jgi:hypothetical protein
MDPSRWRRVFFVVSAALAAAALRLAWEAPVVGGAMLVVSAAYVAFRLLGRRFARRSLASGDIDQLLARWQSVVHRVPHPETMGPLMTATALVAYGWVTRARQVMDQAERGPAWEAAIEHRLFLDALLSIFEGDSARALERAGRLELMPLPDMLPLLGERVRVLRQSVGALARAFAHCASETDRAIMVEAGSTSPLVHWAMRYGAAIFDIDRGELARADTLLTGAPEWPDESCFRRFDAEIRGELSRRASPGDVEPPNAGAPGGGSVVDKED